MPEKMLSIEQDVRSFIQNNLLFGQELTFNDEDSFLEAGIIDSTGILELVHFLEEQYGLKVEDNELSPENLDSVSRVGMYVRTKDSTHRTAALPAPDRISATEDREIG